MIDDPILNNYPLLYRSTSLKLPEQIISELPVVPSGTALVICQIGPRLIGGGVPLPIVISNTSQSDIIITAGQAENMHGPQYVFLVQLLPQVFDIPVWVEMSHVADVSIQCLVIDPVAATKHNKHSIQVALTKYFARMDSSISVSASDAAEDRAADIRDRLLADPPDIAGIEVEFVSLTEVSLLESGPTEYVAGKGDLDFRTFPG